MLLAALVIAGRAGELLSDHSILEIYRGSGSSGSSRSAPSAAEVTRLAQREIDGFRRRLRRHGVDDRALVRRVRKSAAGGRAAAGVPSAVGAWRLDGSVAAEGMSPLNVRAAAATASAPTRRRRRADIDSVSLPRGGGRRSQRLSHKAISSRLSDSETRHFRGLWDSLSVPSLPLRAPRPPIRGQG